MFLDIVPYQNKFHRLQDFRTEGNETVLIDAKPS